MRIITRKASTRTKFMFPFSLFIAFLLSSSISLSAQNTSEAWLYGKVTTWDGDIYEDPIYIFWEDVELVEFK